MPHARPRPLVGAPGTAASLEELLVGGPTPNLHYSYRQHGASDREIAEAVAQAALTRHWSTMMNGLQIDFEAFKAEFAQ